MSRTVLPFSAPDMSALARSLHAELAKREGIPGHLELLNMLARAAGFRNFQHFRAQAAAREAVENPAPPPPPAPEVDFAKVQRIARYFDAAGRLIRWPGKHSHREPCLWVLWSRLPAGGTLDERAISELLGTWHLFEDHALLRRELVDYGLATRTPDGREYRRLERQPPPEALALIRHLAARNG